jgi:glutaredoxin 3
MPVQSRSGKRLQAARPIVFRQRGGQSPPSPDGTAGMPQESLRGTDLGLSALNAQMAPRIRMYTTRWCGYCVRAKRLLEGKGLPYEEINLDEDPAFRQRLHELTGNWTVPQILIDERPIGGYTELWRLDRTGALDELLAA